MVGYVEPTIKGLEGDGTMRLRWMQLRLAAGLFAAGILSLTVASAWAFGR
jgi:hypothetical protein